MVNLILKFIDFLIIFHTYDTIIINVLSLLYLMTTDLQKFEEKRKTNIANTIGNTFWMGMEDLSRTISGTQKPNAK